MAKPPLPITALTGFLGAGKTTVLEYWLTHNHGLKLGVVVNDYGDINLDAQFVASTDSDPSTTATMELSNGCICCSLDSLELGEALDQFATPGSDIDHIIIEASGLAEPVDLAATLKQASGNKTRLDAIVAVLDPVNAFANADSTKLTRELITHSQFAIINKIDVASAQQVDRLKGLINELAPRLRRVEANHGEVDLRLMLDLDDDVPNIADAAVAADHHSHTHAHYGSLSLSFEQPLAAVAFERFVNTQIPADIFRAKGMVCLQTPDGIASYRFQQVGKQASIVPNVSAAHSNERIKSELVFIGRNIDAASLRRGLERCLTHGGDNAGHQGK